MKVKEIKDWKAIHFPGCAYLHKDQKVMSKGQWEALMEVEVKPMKAKGHYEIVV